MIGTISLNDIKYDLLKIIEPWDGVLEENNAKPVRRLFNRYLEDLQKAEMIHDYSIDVSSRESAFTFDINIKIASNRSPKKLKIHVGIFQPPWIEKKETA